jgi:hypothetical protein
MSITSRIAGAITPVISGRVANNGTTPTIIDGGVWNSAWGGTWGGSWGRVVTPAITASPAVETTARVSATASGGITKRV